MANIGSLALKIVADASGFKTGVDAAKAVIDGLVSHAEKAAEKIKGFFAGGLFGAITGIGGGWGGGLAGLVMAPFNAAIDAIGHAVKRVNEQWDAMAPAIKDAYTEAQRLGTSTDVVMGLGRAGFEHEMLRKLRLNEGTGDLVESVAKTADEYLALGTAIERANFAKERFGKSGQEVANILGRGGAWVRSEVQMWRDLGVAVGDADAAKVASALKAQKRLKGIWDGFWTQIVIGAAPAFEMWYKRFEQMGPYIAKLGQSIGQMLGAGVEAGVILLKSIGGDILNIGASWLGVGNAQQTVFKTLEDWTDSAVNSIYDLAGAIADMWDSMKLGAATALPALGRAVDELGKMGISVRQMMLDIEFKSFQISNPLTYLANKTLLDTAYQETKDKLAAEGGKTFENLGKGIADAILKNANIGEAGILLDIAKNERLLQSFNRFAPEKPPLADLVKPEDAFKYTPVNAMEMNSQAANEIIAKWQTGLMANPQLDESKKQTKILEDISSTLHGGMRFHSDGSFEVLDILDG